MKKIGIEFLIVSSHLESGCQLIATTHEIVSELLPLSSIDVMGLLLTACTWLSHVVVLVVDTNIWAGKTV